MSCNVARSLFSLFLTEVCRFPIQIAYIQNTSVIFNIKNVRGVKSSDSDLPADLESRCAGDAVETAEFADGRAVVYGYAAESVAGFDRVPAHGLSFCIFLLVIFGILHLVLEVLFVIAIYVEVFLLQDKETVTEYALLEIDEPLRVEGEAVVAGLEMEMRACRTSCRAAKSYDITGIYPVSCLYIPLRKMGIESLDAVVMTDHYKVSESAHIL